MPETFAVPTLSGQDLVTARQMLAGYLARTTGKVSPWERLRREYATTITMMLDKLTGKDAQPAKARLDLNETHATTLSQVTQLYLKSADADEDKELLAAAKALLAKLG
jgi:hypothetical protein